MVEVRKDEEQDENLLDAQDAERNFGGFYQWFVEDSPGSVAQVEHVGRPINGYEHRQCAERGQYYLINEQEKP